MSPNVTIYITLREGEREGGERERGERERGRERVLVSATRRMQNITTF